MMIAEQLPVVTATLDCDTHPKICREQGCYRFPTIRWFHKGNVLVKDYNRGRNAHKLLRFVKKTLTEINERSTSHTEETNVEPVRAQKFLDAVVFDVPKDTNDDANYGERHLVKSVAFMMKQPDTKR